MIKIVFKGNVSVPLLCALYACMIWFTPTPLCAAPVVNVEQGIRSYALGMYMEMLEDSQGKLTIKDISQTDRADSFIQSHDKVPNLGYTSSIYWIRFTLKNNTGEDIERYLQLGYVLVDDIRLYIPDSSGGYSEKRAGRIIPFSHKEIKNRNYVFTLSLKKDEQATYYLCVKSKDSLIIPLTLWLPASFREYDHKEQFYLGLYYGIILVMILYNLFIFLSLRDKNYLYYILTLTTHHGLFQMAVNGLSYEYIGPHSLWWARESISIFFCLGMVFSMQFAKSFLDTKKSTPYIHNYLTIIMTWGTIEVLLSFFINYYYAIQSAVIMGMAGALGIWIAVILNLVRGNRAARFFMIAWSAVLFGGSIYALKVWGILPSNYITEYTWQVGLGLEAILLSLALADRINFIKKEKEQAQAQAYELIENAVEGIFRITPDGKFINANSSMARILGYKSVEEIISGSSEIAEKSFLHAEEASMFARHLRKQGNVKGIEVQGLRRDGSIFWASISARTVYDIHGHVLYYEGFLMEITERKEREKAEKARETAEASTRAKNQFLANMSHEIRTPITAIMGFTDLVLKTDLNQRQRDYINKIMSSSRSLSGIINDILDFSKIEAGMLNLETVEFDLNKVIDDLIDMFSEKISGKGLEFILSIEEDVPCKLLGDPLRLSQVLTNLMSNAVKFTDQGEIEVMVSLVGKDVNRATIKFSIEDTGVGIVHDKLPNLFEPFTQADGSITRQYGGTGLGLSISKRLVELMGGEIGAESEQGTGSIFYFTISFPYSHENGIHDELSENLHGVKVLVADDTISTREVLKKMLTSFHLDVTIADSAKDVINKIHLSVGAKPYQLVIMDSIMHGTDGIEISRMIRNDPTCNHVPIILLTEFGHEEMILKADDAKINGFLIKPVRRSYLINIIREILTKRPKSLEEEDFNQGFASKFPKHLSGAHILVVEDNNIVQQVVQEILESAGIIIEIAGNGKEALDAVKRTRYDAVLMDIQMPVMDGIKATQLIRSDPNYKDLPIIAMTAHAMKGDRDTCLETGMNDFVPKPIDIEQLFSALAKWVKKPMAMN